MDNNDSLRSRRPLPSPGAAPAQRPNTPVPGISSVAPSSFYSTQKPPPLPTRPKNVGSNLTAYVPPSDSLPTYDSNPPGFREPELITETGQDDMIPELIPTQEMDSRDWNDRVGTTPYDSTSTWPTNWSGGDHDREWGAYSAPASAWTGENDSSNFNAMDYLNSNAKNTVEVAIGDRSTYEELHWWNHSHSESTKRPGQGMLPPVLAEELHNPDHSLFSVSATSPPSQVAQTTSPVPPSTEPLAPQNTDSSPSLSASQATAATTSQATTSPPPSEEDVRTAVPHPNAYFCPKENGWVILSWKSSAVAPPLARSYQNSQQHPLPDQFRRRQANSCLIDEEQPNRRTNKTHHFHKYEKAVDAHKLTTPFYRDEWVALETVKQKRRAGTIIMEDIDLEKMETQAEQVLVEDKEEEKEGRLLDLYVCCQCSFYCVASGVIPGVIPRKFFEEFVREKRSNPQVGKTGEQAIGVALDTIIMAIENKLWKGENRMLRAARTGFQNKVGWNANIKRIFEILGFVEEPFEDGFALRPPVTEISSPQGRINRRKLLRAWVEVSAWTVDFRRIHASHFKDQKTQKLYVQLDSAREMYQTAIGAHHDQIPRGELSDTLMTALQPLQAAWKCLGLTPTTYSPELLAFAYLAQCRCDPTGTLTYFTHFSTLVRTMQNLGSCPTLLQELLVIEQSRDRFTTEDLTKAITTLGFGPEGPLKVEYDNDIPEDFIENAWRECVKKSWRDPTHGSDTHRAANEAFRMIAESRGSVKLRKIWEAGKDRLMNPDRAYDTLEIPKDVDDNMLITVFSMRLEEQPHQIEKMQEALLVIAEVRDSERLRRFLTSGQDPGDIVAPTRPDLPRGLNQLGNTCYLNSLLQYFYTIKELREAVMPMSKLDLKSLDDEKLSDDDLKRHRVGGRLVTRREILRSKKFINQLADLFFNLEYSETAAVTPTIELAKLALVTSRDEEEDEADKGGTDSSNDTDATLVDDGPSRFPLADVPSSPQSPSRSSSSVLGKRPRDIDRQKSEMDVDTPPESPKEHDGYVMISSPRRDKSPQAQASSSKLPEVPTVAATVDIDGDVEMRNSPVAQKAPPLPARKATDVSSSVMMFGKQHDVAECMDNCMFQIETALLKFDGMSDSSDEGGNKTSVVKRLFYGKIRQRLTGTQNEPRSRSSIHEKEDLFSHLPVNVTDDGVDIYDGLSGYFDDVVEFEGRKARMEVSLVDLPPLLQIQLQRVQFNRDTLQPYKSQAYVKFGETIYMDRFMETAEPEKKARSKAVQTELNSCRERVRLLIEGKDGPYISALEHTSKFLSKLSDIDVPALDTGLLLQLNEEQELVKEEIEQLRARIERLKDELESIWKDNTEIAYELTSVFIHRGSSPSWGHYFFYSRHLPDAPDSWFKYNDSDVTVVSKDEVLADTTGSTANPYLLVFARKGSEVVNTVNRFDTSQLDQS